MASTIKLKNGSGAPITGDLVQGEPALDLTNKRLYTENASGVVIEVGTSPSTIDINAGTIDGTVIGGSTPAALSATTGSFSSTLGVTAAATFASTLKTGGGAASNTSKLMVNTVSGTAAGIQLFQDGVESWIIQNPASTTALTFANSGSERLRITATGNVGIGVTSPSSYYATQLVVNGGTDGGITVVNTTTGDGRLMFADGTSGTDRYTGQIFYNHSSNYMAFGTNGGTERARIDSSGHLIVPNGITLGTAVGTYNAANTLDDYEEGTWTPALTFETAGDLSVVYAAERIGTYSKIGDLVIAQFSVQCTTFTHTTASGNLQMTGLPFASVRNTTDFSGVGLNSFQGITKANYTQIGATTLNGGSYIFFSICGSGQGALNVAAADMPSGTLKLLRGTVIYRA
jgi:hypothetical protein